ncbi:hypothetical protein GCM10027300_23950 [Modestobacter lapidis]
MPIPALNIIAIQETVRNSGRSPSRPSGMRPYLLAATQITKMTNPDARTTNSQPRFSSTQASALPLVLPRFPGAMKPQATKARATTAATPKTTVSSVPVRPVSAGGWARAGCRSANDPTRRGPGSSPVWPGGAVGVLDMMCLAPRCGASPFTSVGRPSSRCSGRRSSSHRAACPAGNANRG